MTAAGHERCMVELLPSMVSFPRGLDQSSALSPPPRAGQGDDAAFIDDLCQGKGAALAQLYREHHEGVRAFVRRLTSDGEAAEDLVHDTFVVAPNAFRRYRGEGSVRSFLFGIAVQVVRRHVRGAQRRRAWLARFWSDPASQESPSHPTNPGEKRELTLRLLRALDTLSFDHRVVVVLCEVEERTSVEVAEMLGIPEGTVRTRLHHAKKKLRRQLEALHG